MKADQQAPSRAYGRIARAIHYLAEHQQEQPGLAELGDHVGLSESHLQREFTRWAGVSPKAFLRYLTKESAKSRLRDESVMDAALACGLSGAGRLHDLMISCEGMTPGEYKQRGRDLRIRFGIHPSPFGHCLIATTDRGICKMAFIDTAQDGRVAERELFEAWSAADISRDDSQTGAVAAAVFDRSHGGSLHLLLRGTPFQLRVWEALLSIPEGALASYQQVAEMVGKPTAVRSVASAIARNRIGYLIPCHRVIRSNGDFGQYRWGSDRKKALAGWEAAQRAAATA
ncbi:MAG: methylated-DNA--[protein]-cysteine S-methyltransferase [Gammaproteobacteria bacterium]|nr:methylated-DNA--[protein]-cysteine S-methyltransferase [Gammaproteobacteria bacterium]